MFTSVWSIPASGLGIFGRAGTGGRRADRAAGREGGREGWKEGKVTDGPSGSRPGAASRGRTVTFRTGTGREAAVLGFRRWLFAGGRCRREHAVVTTVAAAAAAVAAAAVSGEGWQWVTRHVPAGCGPGYLRLGGGSCDSVCGPSGWPGE